MSAEEKILDARFLEPPEPMIRTLDALDTLAPGQVLCLLLGREPYPLYDILARNGYEHATTPRDDGVFEIRIKKRD